MAKDNDKKEKATIKDLDDLVASMQKKYGAESVSLYGKNQVVVEWVPVSSFYLTELLGNGYPRGRMIEIYGPESSGKTTLACYLAGQCQRHYFEDKQRNGVVAYVDVEHALDPDYARVFGLDMDKVIFSQPDSAEQALDIIEDLVESDVVDMVVLDSVAALSPQAELDGEMGDCQMGLLARLMGKACRKLQSAMKPKSPTVVFINQIRTAIGIIWGNPERTTGGNALKFFAAIRLVTRAKDKVEDKDGNQIGMISRIQSIKNKVSTPHRKCDMKILFDSGYQIEEEYVTAFLKYGIIKKAGGWFSLPVDGPDADPEKIQGAERVIEWLRTHPVVYDDFKTKLQSAMSRKTTSVVVEAVNEDDAAIISEQEALEKDALAEDSVEGATEGVFINARSGE
jgi:recombination protein RecA